MKFYTDKDIEKIVGKLTQKYYEQLPEEKLWKVHGKEKDLIVCDVGNGWYTIEEV